MALHLEEGAVEIIAEDMDLRQVLEELFMLMDVKYELYPEVQGQVSVSLHNANYAQALREILDGTFTYDIGPHDVIYVHKSGTTWMPGQEEAA